MFSTAGHFIGFLKDPFHICFTVLPSNHPLGSATKGEQKFIRYQRAEKVQKEVFVLLFV